MSRSEDLDGPLHGPASGDTPTEAVIMLHGYGADGNDLIGLAPFFSEALPGAVFYSPHAPNPCEISPFGRQWFSLADYDSAAMLNDPDKQSKAFMDMFSSIEQAAPQVDTFIDSIMERHSLPANKVALLGFSQGTMLALHVAPRRKQQLGGVLGFSGALAGADKLDSDIMTKPPVKLIHGDQDPVVPFQAMASAESALQKAGIRVSTTTRPGLAHGIDTEGAVRGSHFLAHNLTATQ